MPGSPFVLGITVYDTDGSTPKDGVTVLIRNENTNETQTETTNASGEVIFNLANFSSGWTVGDIISYFVFYAGYQASGSFTSTDTGGTTTTLTLIAVPDSASLRYFTVQEFLDTFELATYDSDNENGIKPQTVVKIGQGIETEIDQLTHRKWDDNGGSYHLVTQEYHNAEGDYSKWPGNDPNISSQHIYFTKWSPIYSLTTFQVNLNSPNQSADWSTLTETDNQIAMKEGIGRIEITDSTDYPAAGKDQVRITYLVGMATTPSDIKRLAILMTARAFATQSIQRLNIEVTEARAIQEATLLRSYDEEIKSILDTRMHKSVRTI